MTAQEPDLFRPSTSLLVRVVKTWMPATSAGMTGNSVIARSEATKQSSADASELDCFAPLAMTTHTTKKPRGGAAGLLILNIVMRI